MSGYHRAEQAIRVASFILRTLEARRGAPARRERRGATRGTGLPGPDRGLDGGTIGAGATLDKGRGRAEVLPLILAT